MHVPMNSMTAKGSLKKAAGLESSRVFNSSRAFLPSESEGHHDVIEMLVNLDGSTNMSLPMLYLYLLLVLSYTLQPT